MKAKKIKKKSVSTMKQISNKEYEKYQQYQTNKLHGRILSVFLCSNGKEIVCQVGVTLDKVLHERIFGRIGTRRIVIVVMLFQ